MSVVDTKSNPQYIHRWALKPKRDARGRPIEGKFLPAWGGRRQSKYDPVVEDNKRGFRQ